MQHPFSARAARALLVITTAVGAACFTDDKSAATPDTDGTTEKETLEEPTGDGETGGDDGERENPSCRTKKVDLLFVIDNSGSMSEEQAKLARTVPSLLGILATGNHSGKRSNPGEPTDFVPADSIHIGVISTDMGINLASPVNSCGELSFLATEQDTRRSTLRVNKPFGDDGLLLSSTAVAQSGISAPHADASRVVVPPEPACAEVELERGYIEYGPDDLFEDTGFAFSCISKLGRNGCGLEQQLEAMLKALTPTDSSLAFSRDTRGHGSDQNEGFLREDAILAVVHISDEEDCSIPDSSSGMFDGTSMVYPGAINTRCGLPENQSALHPAARYVEGLKALKRARYRDRIIFASIVGAPGSDQTGASVHSGAEELEALLARPDMQFATQRNEAGTDDVPVPTCKSPNGDGSASPGRRFVEVASAFGDHGLVSSICEESYHGLIGAISERVSRHLGACD
jgi:hypothetical protein